MKFLIWWRKEIWHSPCLDFWHPGRKELSDNLSKASQPLLGSSEGSSQVPPSKEAENETDFNHDYGDCGDCGDCGCMDFTLMWSKKLTTESKFLPLNLTTIILRNNFLFNAHFEWFLKYTVMKSDGDDHDSWLMVVMIDDWWLMVVMIVIDYQWWRWLIINGGDYHDWGLMVEMIDN